MKSIERRMPRSSSSSPSRSFSKPAVRPSSPSKSSTKSSSPTPAPMAPTVVRHDHNTSMGIMDGVKWGVGAAIGRSIGNLFGFGTQNVNVENRTAPPTPPQKSAFDTCVETTHHEKKLSYCYEYDKCLQAKASVNCAEEAENKLSIYADS